MKYYKEVSGKGRVALNAQEIQKLFENDKPADEPVDEMAALKRELSAMSQAMQKLCSNDFVASLLSVNKGEGDENGY